MRALWREYLFTCATLVVSLCVFAPAFANAADINLSPDSGTFEQGKQFSVQVVVDPGTNSVNAADGEVSFNKDVLSISSISKDSSSFTLWTSEPTFSNGDGTVSFSGGTPSAFSKQGTIITIKFKAKTVGTALVSITKGSVLAADGKGTDVFKKGGQATYTIVAAKAEAPPAPPVDDNAATSNGEQAPLPPAPKIDSSTHPKEDSWYATSTAIFTWNTFADVVGVRTLMSDQDNQTPTTTLKGATTTQSFRGVKDGVHFFYVQLKNDFGWGELAKKKFQIDTVQPKEFSVALAGADSKEPKLTFKTTDELSGVDRYEILFGTSVVTTVRSQDLKDDGYPVPPQDGGQTKVTIRAYDMANNVREATASLTLPKVAKPAKAVDGAAVQQGTPWFLWILILILVFISGVLATRVYYLKKAMETERIKILERIAALGDKSDRVFSAMREEFEQMVEDFDEKPQLTPEEREFLENLKEVLDISEEIIDTDIDEMKKMIRGQ